VALLTAEALAASVVVAFSYTVPARAQSTPVNTITVTSANDAGEGSLRRAITTANSTSGEDKIVFDLGASATITLTSQLPL
jgi:hypothetical protein